MLCDWLEVGIEIGKIGLGLAKRKSRIQTQFVNNIWSVDLASSPGPCLYRDDRLDDEPNLANGK